MFYCHLCRERRREREGEGEELTWRDAVNKFMKESFMKVSHERCTLRLCCSGASVCVKCQMNIDSGCPMFIVHDIRHVSVLCKIVCV